MHWIWSKISYRILSIKSIEWSVCLSFVVHCLRFWLNIQFLYTITFSENIYGKKVTKNIKKAKFKMETNECLMRFSFISQNYYFVCFVFVLLLLSTSNIQQTLFWIRQLDYEYKMFITRLTRATNTSDSPNWTFSEQVQIETETYRMSRNMFHCNNNQLKFIFRYFSFRAVSFFYFVFPNFVYFSYSLGRRLLPYIAVYPPYVYIVYSNYDFTLTLWVRLTIRPHTNNRGILMHVRHRNLLHSLALSYQKIDISLYPYPFFIPSLALS